MASARKAVVLTALLTATLLTAGLTGIGAAQAQQPARNASPEDICWSYACERIWCTPNRHGFIDVTEGHQFAADITWAFDQGLVTGWSEDNTYRPHLPVARDAMAAFLYRLAGQPDFTPPAKSPFADVTTNHAYYKQIAWLAAEGISTGWPEDNTFRPNLPVARDAMAAFLYRLAGEPAFEPADFRFADVAGDHPFRRAIEWMDHWGIATGWLEDRTYRPWQPVNRDAMAAFMYRWNLVYGTFPAYAYDVR